MAVPAGFPPARPRSFGDEDEDSEDESDYGSGYAEAGWPGGALGQLWGAGMGPLRPGQTAPASEYEALSALDERNVVVGLPRHILRALPTRAWRPGDAAKTYALAGSCRGPLLSSWQVPHLSGGLRPGGRPARAALLARLPPVVP
jgi:hypothetical protein